MNHNPPLLTTDQLMNATELQIMQAQYEFIVAAVSLAYALIIFYFVFKICIWFFPKFWKLPSERQQ